MTILVLTKTEFIDLYKTDPYLQEFIKEYITAYASKVRKINQKTFLNTIRWDKHEYLQNPDKDYIVILKKSHLVYDAISFAIRIRPTGIFQSLPQYYFKRRSWYIYGTWVHPNQRNKGLNKLLLQTLQTHTTASFLLAVIHNTNEASKTSFLKSNFIPISSYKSPYTDSQWFVKAFSKHNEVSA